MSTVYVYQYNGGNGEWVYKVHPCVGGSEQEHLLGEMYKLMFSNGGTSGMNPLLPVSRFSVNAARQGME